MRRIGLENQNDRRALLWRDRWKAADDLGPGEAGGTAAAATVSADSTLAGGSASVGRRTRMLSVLFPVVEGIRVGRKLEADLTRRTIDIGFRICSARIITDSRGSQSCFDDDDRSGLADGRTIRTGFFFDPSKNHEAVDLYLPYSWTVAVI
jgi:hypothetical protein